jgi:TIR domain
MKPATVFISYAHEDAHLFKQLQTHLTILKRQNVIHTWHEGMIAAGEDWRTKAQRELAAADVVLLLASPDFLASDYLYSEHLTRAIERHQRHEMKVIPIIVRECQWTETALGELRALPMTGEPLKKWQDEDAFWKTIAVGIREAITEFSAQQPTTSTEPTFTQPSAPAKDMTRVRSAYRLLHQYHRHLFDVVRQVLHESAARMGTLNAAGWGSHLFDMPVRKDKNPTDKWVYDFMPLAHAHTWWATAKKPTPGAVFLAAWHCADDAVENAREEIPDDEPDVKKFAPAENSKTTLDFYVEAIVRLDPEVQVVDWGRVDVLIESTRGFDDETWRDGRIHEVSTSAWAVRYGGFSCVMSELQTRQDVERLVVKRVLPLIDQARAP